MVDRESKVSVWSLSHAQLARQCQLIAEDESASIEPTLRAEARRLYIAWQDALQAPGKNLEVRERMAAQQAGLRKRTIEILIKSARQRSGNP